MRKSMLFLPVLLAALFIFAAAAATAAEVRIAYANLQKALNESEAGVKAKEELQAEAKKLEDELNSKQEGLKKLKDELDKKSSVWNKETKETKEREYREKAEEFQRQFMEYNDKLNEKKQAKEAEIIEELRDVVEEIAKKKGYGYVFEKSVSGLLYAPDDADLTAEVISAHNKKSKSKGK